MIILLRIPMPRFQDYNYSQHIMLVVNLEEQLQPGTFEHAIHQLIEHNIDLAVFYQRYNNDQTGRPAYDPSLLLKIILFAYSKGITSSREIEWCCQTNIIFKALSCDLVPHWTTIADFVSTSSAAILSVFEQVLLICDEQGLLGHELLAIDGCKMPSNAGKEWSGTLKDLTAKQQKLRQQIKYHLKAHQGCDQTEQFEQAARHEQAVHTLEAAADRIQRFLVDAEPRMGTGKKPKEVQSNITDNESAKMKTGKGTIQGYNGVATADTKHQIVVDASAFGEGPEQHTLPVVLEQIEERYARLGIDPNILTDITITADTGFASETNMAYLHGRSIDAYVPDNQFRSRDPKFQDRKKKHPHWNRQDRPLNPRIPAREFDFDPVAKTCVCPAGEGMWLRSETASPPKMFFEGRLTKCRHCDLKSKCMRNPDAANDRHGHGRQVSFTLNDKRPPNFTDWMKQRVDSDHGKQIYSHRMSAIEPVFGNIEHNKGLKRFSLRGKTKVNGQWQLYCLIHNIEKLKNYGQIAA
jgi:transposase